MRQIRWSDNDRYFGPLTVSKNSKSYNPWALELDSGSGDEESAGCRLRVSAFGWTVILLLPQVLKPWRQWVDTSRHSWSSSPDGGYWSSHRKVYGVSYSDGMVRLSYGPQTMDSSTTVDKCWFLPWTQTRLVRHDFYDLDGKFMFPDVKRMPGKPFDFEKSRAILERVPKAFFLIQDFDGEKILVTAYIQEMEWHQGEGWFEWVSWFCKPLIRRSLDISFSAETGQRKGSWKGGTLGTSINFVDMGELHEDALRRYCEMQAMVLLERLPT